ncbi:hypothetical protein EZV73_23485 [Acidaminobacter sp. JC074]|uniref:hypothetical protein n=1 Tax=Acidaminobacter sp. JC074 TaxID=2530199 RepID=UPI001F1075F7|nr:hypothetical protein [Acidaminobacter sp. JC074]MCH4890564.1 hypothetical protein [Acidaminobacter sp. JC074]
MFVDINNRIDRLIDKLDDVEVRRLQLEYLKTVAERLERESGSCEKCSYLKEDLQDALNIIEKAEEIKESHRRAYNTRIKTIISHFRKVHNLKSKSHYETQYSQMGLLGGIIAGIWFFDYLVLMLAIILTGPIIGRFIGKIRDKNNHEDLI